MFMFKSKYIIIFLLLGILSSECQHAPRECCTLKMDNDTSFQITEIDSMDNKTMDTFQMWIDGFFLRNPTSPRNYGKLLHEACINSSLSARDIELIYPTSVEEMTYYYISLTDTSNPWQYAMTTIDTLMTLYADRDSLNCLSCFLNMYMLMDPKKIDREWIGEWNLNRAMYAVIVDNKNSFKKYYDTLDKKYEWLTRDWVFAYEHF